jgi:hypothetical protein
MYFVSIYENRKNETCWNCPKMGVVGRGRTVEGINPTKIYFKTYVNISLSNYYILIKSLKIFKIWLTYMIHLNNYWISLCLFSTFHPFYSRNLIYGGKETQHKMIQFFCPLIRNACTHFFPKGTLTWKPNLDSAL